MKKDIIAGVLTLLLLVPSGLLIGSKIVGSKNNKDQSVSLDNNKDSSSLNSDDSNESVLVVNSSEEGKHDDSEQKLEEDKNEEVKKGTEDQDKDVKKNSEVKNTNVNKKSSANRTNKRNTIKKNTKKTNNKSTKSNTKKNTKSTTSNASKNNTNVNSAKNKSNTSTTTTNNNNNISSEQKVINLIKNNDSSFISNKESKENCKYNFNDKYIRKADTEEIKGIQAAWGLPNDEYYSVSGTRNDKNEENQGAGDMILYYVSSKNGKVYALPSQGNMDAYEINNNKVVKTYPYNGGDSAKWR